MISVGQWDINWDKPRGSKNIQKGAVTLLTKHLKAQMGKNHQQPHETRQRQRKIIRINY
jgi:hypothetical protein